ncbi:MAG: hypothetical protein JKY15_03895, partial [Deltaproteobacteria bacterium]|nr:hypothetical protein [Deltaproteobacteria bacterium]
ETLNTEETIISNGLIQFIQDKGLFYDTLTQLNQTEQARVMRELVSTCNQVHIAFERDPGELTALKETLTYVVLMVEKALEYREADLLGTTPLPWLFRIGKSLESSDSKF